MTAPPAPAPAGTGTGTGAGADQLAEYHRLVARLTAATQRRDAELTEAERAYHAAVATATAELDALVTAVQEAERRATRAAAAVLETDHETDLCWARLRRALGWRAVLLGEPPLPAPGTTAPSATAPGTDPAVAESLLAESLLAQAAHRIADLRGPFIRNPAAAGTQSAESRAAPRSLPWPVLVILPVLGGVVAAVVALVAGRLLTLGRDATGFAGPLRLAGYLTLFLAPFAGVPVAAALVRRLVRWRLDTGGTALVVLGGMTGCALSVALP